VTLSGKKERKQGARSLWVWVVIAFLILISAWTTLIIIAANNQPEMVEIETPAKGS
jgi:hypothetical protein